MQLWNLLKTGLLLAGLSAILVVIGGMLGGTGGMIFALVLAIAMNMGAWWFSDTIALRLSGAHEIDREQAPALYDMVARLAKRANLPMPRVAIIESPMPNAFATGRSPERGVVAVTTGIMQLLSRDELAGVVAHELAHIKNRDTLVSSVAATIAGAITTLANMAQWALLFGGFGGNRDEDSPGPVAGFLMIFLAPIAAFLIQMAISRSREYLADATGAQILGNPHPLADALQKLEMGVQLAPAHVNPATAHQYIVNPLHGDGLFSLFSTHPSTQERIARLRAMTPEQLRAVV